MCVPIARFYLSLCRRECSYEWHEFDLSWNSLHFQCNCKMKWKAAQSRNLFLDWRHRFWIKTRATRCIQIDKSKNIFRPIQHNNKLSKNLLHTIYDDSFDVHYTVWPWWLWWKNSAKVSKESHFGASNHHWDIWFYVINAMKFTDDLFIELYL